MVLLDSSSMAFQFVENGNRDLAIRKLIRSHVMKGKNSGKTRLRSTREEVALASSKLNLSSKSKLVLQNDERLSIKANLLNSTVGNIFSGFEFAWEVKPIMMDLIHQCKHNTMFFEADQKILTYSVVCTSNQSVYPVKFCKPVDSRKRLWFRCLLAYKACKW